MGTELLHAIDPVDASAFGIRHRRGDFEGEQLFEASVQEFPDLYAYSESWEGAYELIVDAIETAAQALAEAGQAVPVPAAPLQEYSGRVTLRLPKSLHRALATRAVEEGVSLNSLLIATLARADR